MILVIMIHDPMLWLAPDTSNCYFLSTVWLLPQKVKHKKVYTPQELSECEKDPV